MIYTVYVGVALSRPPKQDDVVRVRVEAPNATQAGLLASQIAACRRGVVMPVSTEVEA
jgi:hypothetical protein